ncbi:autotransporter outer membrane beta-barrel domain-containing protein [Bartonella rattaustraliani]|uniref:autotransporter outer membrane beta-barrel domain-containing protein n=1 Tax=Bartonella rattaustraliani TaxID=481139 RepID=UPI00178C68F3|nr:autotransporter outer membrane beta-barrel domain-containing protein [Bartonella rattaustraliani]
MVRISKNCLYSCVFTTALFSFLSNIDVGAHSHSSVLLSCNEDKTHYRCNDGKEHTISNKVYKLTKPFEKENGESNSLISSAVIGAQMANTVIQAKHIQVEGAYNIESLYGVVVSQGGKVVLRDSSFKHVSTGFRADNGTIEVYGGLVEAIQSGVYAEKQDTSVILINAKVKVEGQESNQGAALFSGAGAHIKMNGGEIDVIDMATLHVGTGGNANLNGVTMTSKSSKVKGKENIVHAALNVNHQSVFHLKKSSVVAEGMSGLRVGQDNSAQLGADTVGNILLSRIHIEDSKIIATGNKYGMHFDMNKKDKELGSEMVFLKNSVLEAPSGTAIHSSKSSTYLSVTEGTKISGDLLLTAEKGTSVAILADSSSLSGGTRVSEDAIAELYLTEGSKWVLTQRKEEGLQVFNSGFSSISFVKLSKSTIAFENPMSQRYQTLYIGKGKEEAYSAQDSAHLYLNTHLNSDGSFNKRKTDRILIHGDVSGKTTVHVQFLVGDQEEKIGDENAQTVSIIQVSGKAAEDSFQLSVPYIALEGLPYQYYLRAYGPDSARGHAHFEQRLVEGNEDFWDFRLESKYIQPILDEPTLPDIVSKAKDVVPQVPTYLLLPNALFHAGMMDISNKNRHLKKIQNISSGSLKIENTSALSLNGYGGSYRYVSDLSAFEYGYGGDLAYNAVEVGGVLKTIESANNVMSFGIMGNYGKFSLQPEGVAQSQNNAFHKWSMTAYGNVEYEAGFYLNGVLSYGLFKGDVLTLARGRVATLKGNPLNISLSSGKEIVTRYKDFVFDPQIQFIYQNLQFHKGFDIDGFDIEIGKPHQWVMRVGGYLTKIFPESEKNRITSFYGKIHFSHCFGGRQFVHFKDPFQLSSFGSSLEAGLGINSQVSSKMTLHGDLNYQHKLTKAGFSGIHFSGGWRYHF